MNKTCASSSQTIFSQVITLLDMLSDSDYGLALPIFNGSTIGQHFRHILDFYNCVLIGAHHGELNYAHRDRSPSIEVNTSMAKAAFHKLQQDIIKLSDETQLKVHTDFHSEANTVDVIVCSSVGRELMYAYDHAVHHLAIIKIGIRENFNYQGLDESIGVAPSTIMHEASHH